MLFSLNLRNHNEQAPSFLEINRRKSILYPEYKNLTLLLERIYQEQTPQNQIPYPLSFANHRVFFIAFGHSFSPTIAYTA